MTTATPFSQWLLFKIIHSCSHFHPVCIIKYRKNNKSSGSWCTLLTSPDTVHIIPFLKHWQSLLSLPYNLKRKKYFQRKKTTFLFVCLFVVFFFPADVIFVPVLLPLICYVLLSYVYSFPHVSFYLVRKMVNEIWSKLN